MARVKISEYHTKKMLYQACNLPYTGIALNLNQPDISALSDAQTYVLKVDEGVKKRFKNGLVKLDINKSDLLNQATELAAKGYSQFIVEPYVRFDQKAEKYISFERVRAGILIKYSSTGGIDIENNAQSLKQFLFTDQSTATDIENSIDVDIHLLKTLINLFNQDYFAFLEINPLVMQNNQPIFVDAALLVDSTAEFFATNWHTSLL